MYGPSRVYVLLMFFLDGDVEIESVLFDVPEFSRVELVRGPCLHVAFLSARAHTHDQLCHR